MKKFSVIHYIIVGAVLFVAGFAWWAATHEPKYEIFNQYKMVSEGINYSSTPKIQPSKLWGVKFVPILEDPSKRNYAEAFKNVTNATNGMVGYWIA